MITENNLPERFIGLDIHKHYLVAVAVDENGEKLFGPQRVQMADLQAWIPRTLTLQDKVVIEMTTNAWQVHDDLLPHVNSVTVVHPPNVALITRSQVMTDRIAAFNLARLHAKGLLVGIWVPTAEVRQLRYLIAKRNKMVKLSAQSRNRLHAVLHRHHLPLPEEGSPFISDQRSWWIEQALPTAEKVCVICDLDTLTFAKGQISLLEQAINELAAQDERTTLLVQMTGVGIITAQTILSAIGTIERFPSAKHLVGYAGLGARVHNSGQTTRTGKITKAGRRDLRTAMVEVAHIAVLHDPHWKEQFKQRLPRLGYNKAIVAIARKMLVVVWHILTKRESNRFAETDLVARKLMKYAYRIGKANRPAGISTGEYVRQQLDYLGIGRELSHIRRGKVKKPFLLPPSSLAQPGG